MERYEINKYPTLEECLGAMQDNGRQLSHFVMGLKNDSFSKKSADNKRRMKEIEEELARIKYDATDVKRVAMRGGDGNMMTSEEKNAVIRNVGELYMVSMLLRKVMDDTFGEQLRKKGEGGELVYEYCDRHINLVANLLYAFTDRFTWNVKTQAKKLFDIQLDTDKLCTDIDLLAMSNVINAFGTRFVKQIVEQEDIAKAHMEREEKEVEKKKKTLEKEMRAIKKEMKKK